MTDGPPWRDPEKLAELYYGDELSMQDIAEQFGTTRQTIWNWMERFGMERRGLHESHTTGAPELLKDPDALRRELIEVGKTRQQVADELGVSQPTVTKWALDHGITGSNHNRPPVEVECDWCGKSLTRPRWRVETTDHRFCDDDCRGAWISEHYSGPDNQNWRGGHYEYGPGWNREKREAVRERDGLECVACGLTQDDHIDRYAEKLHVHHITPARKFDDPMKRNAMDNLTTLCRTCHWKWEGIPLRPN